MVTDREMYDIGKYGVPREYTACPSCGQQYGHHKTKVCMSCQECSKCCQCKTPDHQPASVAIEKILSGEDEEWQI
jgi:hypothetical protein